jgi:hypothetical protein
MFSVIQIRPLELAYDAPSEEVVKASGRLGLRSPQDVRWTRQAPPRRDAAPSRTFSQRLWRLLFAFGVSEAEETCGCGGVMPERRVVLLRTLAGEEIRYGLTQCERCRAIVWDQE